MKNLKISIFADGADIEQMKAIYKTGNVDGFTTNPSLMKKAGISDYNIFAKNVVKEFPDVSISFEVFADDFDTMKKEAIKISSLGKNVSVKIPIMNSKGESSIPLINKLSHSGVKLNVTAVFTIEQVKDIVDNIDENSQTIVSVFAGRIADTGIDPIDIMSKSAELCHSKKGVKLLWASPREAYNIIQANEVGADIITCTPDLIRKTSKFGKDLEKFSKETVQMFLKDSQSLGYSIL